MKQLDWNEIERRASGMSNEALEYSIKDCRDAAQAAAELEAAGHPVAKSEGYYLDELSVYQAELAERKAKQVHCPKCGRLADEYEIKILFHGQCVRCEVEADDAREAEEADAAEIALWTERYRQDERY